MAATDGDEDGTSAGAPVLPPRDAGGDDLPSLASRLLDVANAVAAAGAPDDAPGRELRRALEAYLEHSRAEVTADGAPGETAYARLARTQLAVDPDQALHVVGHPLMAGQSPVFPALDIAVETDAVSAAVTFGAAFEGPPALVHGGYVSAGFDIIVSMAAAQVSPWSMTRKLQIRFLRPTYLHDRVTFRAEATAGEHRSIGVAATLCDSSGRTTAKATAEFVRFEPERFTDRRGFGVAP